MTRPSKPLPPPLPSTDDDEPWRHKPVAPKDENPLDSFGRAIAETIIGPKKGSDAVEPGSEKAK